MAVDLRTVRDARFGSVEEVVSYLAEHYAEGAAYVFRVGDRIVVVGALHNSLIRQTEDGKFRLSSVAVSLFDRVAFRELGMPRDEPDVVQPEFDVDQLFEELPEVLEGCIFDAIYGHERMFLTDDLLGFAVGHINTSDIKAGERVRATRNDSNVIIKVEKI